MRAADLHRLARTLREIALRATKNIGDDRVNAGELAVLEDIARHPLSTIRDITERTGLAQSLVSRITRSMADAGALTIEADSSDRRKVRVELTTRTRADIVDRAGNSIRTAIYDSTPKLSAEERGALEHHLAEAAELLQRGTGDSGH
ncbi:MarR family transcriptional regulator [Paenarthrobacter sp. PH39-S1]|uniref:MarR family winged helix-turn-helix transcriptional regulator n=1 Tax=Paenarthrobacter sp. PH39-S1 TaxID=3046204 RepID=UPI0024BA366E|nr:MarR family transcriptional regulator [Paenarthrobacter sp. PH39-S1]MDJ0356646.1 MarR family transcriptional regulator [Paenarthrobacter sp. PH39-S1]